MLNLGLTEEQEFLRRAALDFLERESPLTVARAMEQDAVGYPPALWRQIADLGWLGLSFPERYGGAGGSLIDAVILTEQFGRYLVPVPYLSTVFLVGQAILTLGSDEQKSRWLPKIIDGSLIGTLAHVEPGHGYEPRFLTTRAEREKDEFVLHGTKILVNSANIADEILVIARTGDGGSAGEDGVTLFLVPADADGLQRTRMNVISEGHSYELTLDGVRVGLDRVLGPVGGGWAAWQPARQKAIVARCAEMTGMAAAAQEMSVAYAKQRVAFGKPIGAFQAIQHKLVEMQSHLDGMQLAARYAAWRLDHGHDAAYWVSLAKAEASRAVRLIMFEGHEIHAAMGFMRDYDLQLFYRRAKEAEIDFGDFRIHADGLATMLRDDPTLGRII